MLDVAEEGSPSAEESMSSCDSSKGSKVSGGSSLRMQLRNVKLQPTGFNLATFDEPASQLPPSLIVLKKDLNAIECGINVLTPGLKAKVCPRLFLDFFRYSPTTCL